MESVRRAIVWNDDLIFYSRIDNRARATGGKALQAKDLARTLVLCADPLTACVLVDIHVAGEDLGALIAALGKQSSRPRVIGFGSHVEAAALRRARELGCDLVLPRSKFVEDLITRWEEWNLPCAGATAPDKNDPDQEPRAEPVHQGSQTVDG